MAGNGFIICCILETNPFVLNFVKQDFGNCLHLRSKDLVFIIHIKNYLTVQSWLLLIEGSSKSHCALVQSVWQYR